MLDAERLSDTATENASEDSQHFETYLRARNTAELTARAALKTSQEVRRLSAHVQKCNGMYDRSVKTLLCAHEDMEDASHVLVLQRARAKLAEANLRSIGGEEAIESLRATLFDGIFSEEEGSQDEDFQEEQLPRNDDEAPPRSAARKAIAKEKKKKKKPKSGGGVKDGGGMMPQRVFLNDASSRRARAADSGKTLDPGLDMEAHADKVLERRRERKRERDAQSDA